MKERLGLIVTIFTLITTVGGGIFFMDDRYVLASDGQQLVSRLTSLELSQARQQYYDLLDRLRKYPDDEELKREVEEAKEQYELAKSIYRKEKKAAIGMEVESDE